MYACVCNLQKSLNCAYFQGYNENYVSQEGPINTYKHICNSSYVHACTASKNGIKASMLDLVSQSTEIWFDNIFMGLSISNAVDFWSSFGMGFQT